MAFVDLSQYDNSWYDPGRPFWIRAVWFFLGEPLVRCPLLPSSSVRRTVLRWFGARIGKGVVIKPGVRVKYPWRLEVGDHAWIGEDCWIDNVDRVSIGAHACVSQGVYICTGGHQVTDAAFALYTKPVVIGERAWVAAHAMVAPGVELGEGAVAAMGSLVARNLEPYTIAAGNPARLLGPRRVEGAALRAKGEAGMAASKDGGDVAAAGDRAGVGETLRRELRKVSKDVPEEMPGDQWVTSLGLDSLGMLVFREACERTFGVQITDNEWVAMESLDGLRDLICTKRGVAAGGAVRLEPRAAAPVAAQDWDPWGGRAFIERVEVGMPLTGINALAETPLLKYLGDLRWRHIARMSGVPSREMIDAEGNRLYATFFCVELSFPPQRPISGYTENDSFTVVDTLSRFGTSILDGVAYLVDDARKPLIREPFGSVEEANRAGVATARLSNAFVMQFSGAEWLRKSRPREGLIESIPELAGPPDSYALVKRATAGEWLDEPDAAWTATGGEHEHRYKVQPDRDVNGAGLLYFANYPLFLDLAERDALGALAGHADEFINTRALVRRRIAYVANTSWRDTLRIRTRLFTRTTPEGLMVRSEQIMHRVMDDRVMCVSSSEKRIG
jgi:putative colanic acid biosynthesis acetyltransferase WcaF